MPICVAFRSTQNRLANCLNFASEFFERIMYLFFAAMTGFWPHSGLPSQPCPILFHGANCMLEATMPNKPGSHHVVPKSGGWDVKKGGGDRSSGHFDRKQDAIDAGRKISQNQGTELVIHGKNGKIQNKDSHGNDPYPPKG
jgi:hypothetical protein